MCGVGALRLRFRPVEPVHHLRYPTPPAHLLQFYVNPVTVVGMLAVLDIPKGGWLLQTAAGSVLGRQMIQVGCMVGRTACVSGRCPGVWVAGLLGCRRCFRSYPGIFLIGHELHTMCTLQLAKHQGVKTINMVRRAEQAAELLALG